MERLFCLIVLIAAMPACNKSGSTASAPASAKPAVGYSDTQWKANFLEITLLGLNAGESVDDTISTAFKATVAPSLTSNDAAEGYSKGAWVEYCASFRGLFNETVRENLGDEVRKGSRELSFHDQSNATKSRMVYIRLEGKDANSKISWLQVSSMSRNGTSNRPQDLSPWTVNAFLSAMIDKNDKLAIGLMSPALRASLAPVFSKADEARGYNPGTLAEKLRALRGDAAAFEIRNAEVDMIRGSLALSKGSKPFTIKTTVGQHGERLIESISTD